MKHLLLTTIAAVVLVGCGSVFVVHASGQNERSKTKAENVHMTSSTLMANIENDINYIHLANGTLYNTYTYCTRILMAGHKFALGSPFSRRPLRKPPTLKLYRQNIGADVNLKDNLADFLDGPLYIIAAEEGHKKIAELLIKHNGADVNLKTSNGCATLLCNIAADGRSQSEIAKLLLI